MNKEHFLTAQEVKNAFQNVDIHISLSMINHNSEDSPQDAKQWYTSATEKAWLQFTKTHNKKLVWKEEIVKKKEQVMTQIIPSHKKWWFC